MTPDALLRLHAGVARLPHPTPLDLADIPLVRSAVKLERATRADGANGVLTLPVEAYRIEHEVVALDGTRHAILVTGDAVLGLPYGYDGDVLLALFRILDEQIRRNPAWADGEFRNPSVRMIARAMGREFGGELGDRIRAALERFSHVRIQTRLVRNLDATAEALRSGGGDERPLLPDRALGKHVREEEVRWLLEYRWRTEESRNGTGESEDWILHLRVNPFWVNQAIAGWAAWIDPVVHATLDGPIAKRLYQISASHAAKQVPGPWRFEMATLLRACAITSRERPANIRDRLRAAADDLVAAEVLARADVLTGRNRQYTFVFEPGPVLQIAGWLRGAGLLDLDEARTKLCLLRSFGVHPTQARDLLHEKPDQVGHVLGYALFLKETKPATVTKSWSAWIVAGVAADWTFDGDEAYARWRRRRLAPLTHPTPPALQFPAAASVAAAPEPAPPSAAPDTAAARASREETGMGPGMGPGTGEDEGAMPRCHVAPEDPALAALWRDAVTAIGPTVSPWVRLCLEHVAPGAIAAHTLVCYADTELYARTVERHAGDAVAAWLSDRTGGVVTALAVRQAPAAPPHRPS